MLRNDASTLSRILNELLNYIMISSIIFGLAGNFICFRIFHKSKLQKYPISVYIRAISIFDSLMLIHGIFFFFFQNYGLAIQSVNGFFCKLKTYLLYAIGPISPWLMVVVSLDRFINIAFPKRFLFLHKLTLQIAVIIFIVAYNFIFYLLITWTYDVQFSIDNSTGAIEAHCGQISDSYALVWMDLFNSTLLPFLAMIILSVALIYCVRLVRSKVKSGRDNKFAISIITLNFMFLILNLPIVIDDLVSLDTSRSVLYYFIQSLYYYYFAIGFYTQLVVNSDLRHEFLKLFQLRVAAQDERSTINKMDFSNISRG